MEPPVIDSSKKVEQNYSKNRVGEGDVKLDKERLAQALSEEKKRKKRGEDGEDRVGKKQKSALEGGSHDVTEEELGTFLNLVMVNLRCSLFYRGIPNDAADDRRSHGKLCR